MIVESVLIKNFRCVLDETLHCENLTALVGANGSGKSSFLRGLDLFYDTSPKIDQDDFYNRDTSAEIVISITFKDLSSEAKALFSSYLQGDKLTVERVFVWDNNKTSWNYHGATLQNPMFQAVRDGLKIKDRGKTAKEAYENVRKLPEFSTLPEWSTIGAAEDNLKLWESTNPNKCIRQRDEGQFFGFKEVAKGHLGKFTRFLFIPAVRDATDDSAEGRGSVLTELMDLVIRNALATNEELTKFKQETQERYSEIVDPASQTELTTLANKMTDTLKTFVPDSDVRVDLQWQPLSEVNIPLPQADVKLIEDGFSSAIPRTGHGLQRAFILTILQHLAQVQTTQEAAANTDAQDDSAHELQLPDLVLAIEEPELYQHPNRQRHLAKIFFDLASGTIPGVADKTQIFYATHSPLFVGIDRINQIRLFRKVSNALDEPKITSIVSTNLDKVAERIWEANGKPAERYTGTSLLPRLQSIMTPWMNEGFFSDIAVLVEGEDDRAAILGVSTAMGHNLESAGISVIPCGGKTNLDRPAIIFQQLNIPVYVVWDSDKNEESNGARPEDNHRLLRLMGQTITDWPCHIHENFACFENKLEFTLREEIGNVEFDQLLENCQNELYIPKKKHAVKNPVVIATVIQEAQKCGQKSTTLEEIITKILALRG